MSPSILPHFTLAKLKPLLNVFTFQSVAILSLCFVLSLSESKLNDHKLWAAETMLHAPPEPAVTILVKPPKPISLELDKATEKVLKKVSPESVSDLRKIQAQLQRVVGAVDKATVGVMIGPSAGSGVIVSPEGLVLTAGHVNGLPNQKVTFFLADGRRVKGITLGINREIDSGMMKITDPGPWPYVKLADPKSFHPGDWAIVMGHPGGYQPGRTAPVRLGRILSLSPTAILTDCTLVGGDSGGPLFNMRGELIGINSRIGSPITANIHVPIGTYKETWSRLLAGEMWGGKMKSNKGTPAKPLLGLAGYTQQNRCVITQVFPGFPASNAGIKPGDLIKELDGKAITSFERFATIIHKKKPGTFVEILVLRDFKKKRIRVRLSRSLAPLPGEFGAQKPERDFSH